MVPRSASSETHPPDLVADAAGALVGTLGADRHVRVVRPQALVVGPRLVDEAEVEPEVLVEPLVGDHERGVQRRRARAQTAERDAAGAVGEKPAAGQAGQRLDRRRRVARALGQRQVERGGRLAGHPQRGVGAVEARPCPCGDIVLGEPAQPQLAEVGQAIAVASEAHVEQPRPHAAGVPACRLGAQDPALGGEPVEREVGERRGAAAQPPEHVVPVARGVEHAALEVHEAVGLIRASCGAEHRQVLDEVGDASRGRRLVGDPDPEHERRAEHARSRCPEDRQPVDVRALHVASHAEAMCPQRGKTMRPA